MQSPDLSDLDSKISALKPSGERISQEETQVLQSVSAAVRILKAFAVAEGDLGVTELSDQTGFSKSHVSKVVAVLRSEGLLEQLPNRKYRVGQGLFVLGTRFVEANPLSKFAVGLMRRFAEKSGHSLALSVRAGDQIVHMVIVEGTRYPDCRWRTGRPVILHTSAAARVLLSFAPRPEVDRIMARHGYPKITERTILDRAGFHAALDDTVSKGFAETRSEGVPGLGAIALPVFDTHTACRAAIAVLFPEHAVDAKGSERLRTSLRGLAVRVSTFMGCPGYPYPAR